MEHIVFGILAHVDAGKTTLSEGFLFSGGKIKKAGRVDKKDTFLDHDEMERERGITIFSKQAEFEAFGKRFTLLDTPGHIDFYAEAERVLSVLDYAILVISATEGVKSHTLTLWETLKKYEIPTFLFINKMDMEKDGEEALLNHLKTELGTGIIKLPEDFKRSVEKDALLEDIAVLDETLLTKVLEGKEIEHGDIKRLIRERKLFPCYFGSALKFTGVEEFLKAFSLYTEERETEEAFSARVYKVTRDESGTRLVHIRVLGGSLGVKDSVEGEKVNRIRVYSGEKYEERERVNAGEVCALVGFSGCLTGSGLGALKGKDLLPDKMQVMSYKVLLPDDVDSTSVFPKLKELSEEIPELRAKYDGKSGEVHLSLMGEVQKEIVCFLIEKKYGIRASFGEGRILYKETVEEQVEGVGHFEPLRHYAEVHLLLIPAKRGEGLRFESNLPEDSLAGNWQNLILHHLQEREHRGVLTGSPITDMTIRLVAGRAHRKHTEGGDFRQAVYRAVRHGLMRAKSLLLEPMYDFSLEVPERLIGRAMSDLSGRKADFGPPEIKEEKGMLKGRIPVACIKDYPLELRAYSSGEGRLSLSFGGYEPCHNTEEVMASVGYYPEADTEYTADSVFCSHGAGFVVPWDEVENYMHLPYAVQKKEDMEQEEDLAFLRHTRRAERQTGEAVRELFLGYEEVDDILGKAVSSNKKREAESKRNRWKKTKIVTKEEGTSYRPGRPLNTKEDFLLVDGYNIIFAWEELKALAEENIDSARDRLIDVLLNYQGYKGNRVILVFDAYKVRGGKENVISIGDLHVIYTKEAETADQYIAKTSQVLGKEGRVTVATSDGMVQMIIFGTGAIRMSAKDLEKDVKYIEEKIREKI